jgi:hypothetical protein
MKSRKVVVEDEAYGEEDHLTFEPSSSFLSPEIVFIGAAPRRSTTHNAVDIVDARTYFGDRWVKFVDAAIAKAKREGRDLIIAKEDAVDQLMAAWVAKRDKADSEMRGGLGLEKDVV